MKEVGLLNKLPATLNRAVLCATFLVGIALPASTVPTGAASEYLAGGLADLADQASAPYRTTTVAHELCPLPGNNEGVFVFLSALTCQVGRSQYALGQGKLLRSKALEAGATCQEFPITQGQGAAPGITNLWVCFGFDSPLVQRGGTTYGDTFFFHGSPDSFAGLGGRDELLAHESHHVLQWHLMGRRFPTLYAIAGPNACQNLFEVQAGLAHGGYQCAP